MAGRGADNYVGAVLLLLLPLLLLLLRPAALLLPLLLLLRRLPLSVRRTTMGSGLFSM